MVNAKEVLLPATSGSIAVCFTNPLELTKSRLQLDNERAAAGTARKYSGWIDCVGKNFRSDGVRGLQRGLSLAITREFFFNGVRIGLAAPALGIHEKARGRELTWYERFGTNMAVGGLGAAVVNPLEVIKVRMQIQGGATGHQHAYEGVGGAITSLVRDEGFAGCVKGIGVSTFRGILGPGTQLFAYGEFKGHLVKEHGWSATSFGTHVVCALSSAVVSITCVNPTDVVRTRLYNAPDGWYKNGLDAAMQLVRNEGPAAFYKGALTHYLRLGPHMVLVFGILEQLKQHFG